MSTHLPLRVFQQRGSYYVTKLVNGEMDEIVLTVYSKPVAKIFRASEIKKVGEIKAKVFKENVSTPLEEVSTHSEYVSTDVSTLTEEFMGYHFRTKVGWCMGHYEKGVNRKTYLVTWENENGDIVVDHKWYCDMCLKSLIDKRIGKIYE